jgi:hypothetical protein
MSHIRQQTTPAPSASSSERTEPTLWAGWVLFGGMVLILLGGFQAIMGLVALFDDDYYVVRSQDLLIGVGYDWWGWIHLVIGVVAIAAGMGLMRGALWARVTGVAIAMLSALVNLAFIAALPVWATLAIAFDVLIIYAITTHGGELREARY